MIEERAEVGGTSVFWREAAATGPAPVLYLHGVPTSGADWVPFLELAGGYAPDLPGFGRSSKAAGFDYSIEGYGAFLERYVEHLGLDRFSIVVHDWGAVGLALAQVMPERVERLVIMNAVPFLPGYRWHRIARVWRTPVAGELFMGLTTRFGFRQLSREATVRDGPMPGEFVDRMWEHFDHGTQRAILKLYRSAPPERLAAAGRGLGRITCPALVLWGTADPYLPTKFADGYAAALGCDPQVELPETGHWPWIDDPQVVERVAKFLG